MRPANRHPHREPGARPPHGQRRRNADRRPRQPQRRVRQLSSAWTANNYSKAISVTIGETSFASSNRWHTNACDGRTDTPVAGTPTWQREVRSRRACSRSGCSHSPLPSTSSANDARRVRRRCRCARISPKAFRLDSTSLRLSAWILVLSPYLTVQLARGVRRIWRRNCEWRHRFATRRLATPGASVIVFQNADAPVPHIWHNGNKIAEMLKHLKRWLGWDTESGLLDLVTSAPARAARRQPQSRRWRLRRVHGRASSCCPTTHQGATVHRSDVLDNPRLTLDKPPDDGFDPYNTGAFNRSTSWERIGRQRKR